MDHDMFCEDFYLVHNNGTKLYAKKTAGRDGFLVYPHGNLLEDAIEVFTGTELLNHLRHGHSIRAFSKDGEINGIYKLKERSIRSLELAKSD